MKDLLKKPITFEKVEFWIATAIYVFAVFVLLGDALQQDTYRYNLFTVYSIQFTRHNVPFSYTKYHFLPEICRYTIYYLSYVLLTLFIIRPLINGQRIVLNIFLVLGIYLLAAIGLGTTDTWIRAYLLSYHTEEYVYSLLFRHEFIITLFIFLIFGIYTFIKNVYFSVKVNLENSFSGYDQVTQECVVVFGLVLSSVFFLTITHSAVDFIIAWAEMSIAAIALYWYSMSTLIPGVMVKKGDFQSYLLKTISVLAIGFFPVMFLTFAVFRRPEGAIILALFNVGISLFGVVPLSWFLYKRRQNRSVELTGLKTALGSSNANLDFLRSQINPHFLFNALNTLYGTSLQENAERTGEGIQKLGDMMRFMLQENMQEKIALTREIDYLNNYIDLQKLRTQTSPDISIITEIDEQIGVLQIAPMLLIPFVENAFKHGISLREPSHIKISLQTRDNELLFDVYNSIHPKTSSDPEKHKSGIGLENVKQRLMLLYPKRHELVIRESAKEFFIHLTIQL